MSDYLSSVGIPQDATIKYLLVLVRVGTMFSIFPVFSAKQIPLQVKFALSAIMAFLIVGTLPHLVAPSNIADLAIDIASQIFLGMAIGFVGMLLMAGIQFAGEIIDTQVGFAVTNIINPMTGTSVSVLGQFELILATFIFLITDSHHLIIEGMAGSFHLVPLPSINVAPQLMGDIMGVFVEGVNLVFKIAIPIAVTLLLTNIAMAFLARVAPQMNVFIVAYPAQLGIGMTMFLLTLPLLGFVLPEMFGNMPVTMDHMLRHMAPKAAP